MMLLVIATGCLNDDNLIPENCYDGILNNGEELVDCGGSICPPCDPCENGQYDALLGESLGGLRWRVRSVRPQLQWRAGSRGIGHRLRRRYRCGMR